MTIQQKFNLTNKVAIITGASKGIGKAIAEALGDCGAKIVVSSRKQEAVDVVAKEFQQKGIDAISIAAHTGDNQQIETLVQKTIAHFGGIDIVVNNAATNPSFGPILTTDDETFDKIMQVNVKGPLNLAKLAFPSMLERGGGSIINISSVEGISPGMGLGLYSVSKAALISLTKVLAREWGGANVRVNVICPGLIDTKFSSAITSSEEIVKMVMKKQIIQRIGKVEEMAGLALFLASEAGSYCTGGVYAADGGYTV